MPDNDIWPSRNLPSEMEEAQGMALPTIHKPQPAAQLKAILTEANSALRNDKLGELYARRYFKECIDGMMEIARDGNSDPAIRLKAYSEVYAITFGRPASVIRVPGDSHVPPTIDYDVAQAVATAELLGLAADYASTPPDQWPAHVREALDKAGQGLLGSQKQ